MNKDSSQIRVFLDTTPLQNKNAIRGVGRYTAFLAESLESLKGVKVLESKDASSAEIVHYPFFDLFFNTLPWRHSAPAVVTIHDLIPLVFPKQYDPGIKGRFKFWMQKLALKSVKAVITDSEASKSDIVKYLNIDPDQIHVVPLAANPNLNQASESKINTVKEKYHLPEKYILYVGDINFNKNIPALIKSLEYLPEDINLVLVGKNFRAQRIPEWEAIDRQIAVSNNDQRIHFISSIESDANAVLSALYSGAVVYVQPSLYEGFGLPVLEAMQAGTPVVASSNSSLIEVVGQAGILTGSDPKLLAEGVSEVLNWSKKERLNKIEKGLVWAKNFSWKKTAQKTLEVYKNVIEQNQVDRKSKEKAL